MKTVVFMVAEAGLDLHFLPGAENRGSPPSSRRRQRSSALHLDGFESTFFTSIKKTPSGWMGFLYGCGGRTRTYDLRVMRGRKSRFSQLFMLLFCVISVIFPYIVD